MSAHAHMSVAAAAIERSVRHNEIVTIDADAQAHEALRSQADDWVDNGAVVEYWGRDDEGNDWRVHVAKRTEVRS